MNLLKFVVYVSLRTLVQFWHMIRDRLAITKHTGVLQYLGVPITRGKLRMVDCSMVEQAI